LFLCQFVSLYFQKQDQLTNSEIEQKLMLTARLMELHDDNTFKIRSYQTAADTIYRIQNELSTLSREEIVAIDGIGKGMANNISELLVSGTCESLQKLLDLTPTGIIEMMGISGFGPKKVGMLWKETSAESLDDILLLCQQGKVAKIKGFGEKSQDALYRATQFMISNRGKEKYANIEPVMNELLEILKKIPAVEVVSVTGDVRRKLEIIEELEFLIGTSDFDACIDSIDGLGILNEDFDLSGPFAWVGHHAAVKTPVKIRFCEPQDFIIELIKTTGSVAHLNLPLADGSTLKGRLVSNVESEQAFYRSIGLPYIVPELREGRKEIEWAQADRLPKLIEMSDLKGILHNHSTYSDGKHTLRQMAEHCKNLGYEYLGISDHSQTAVYAHGLQEYHVRQQQEEIRQLNVELAPFKVFSGIESDILGDGSLDYSTEILASFDFIVASVHSGLSMDVNKATNRLLTAIHNPFTTILGHMTGRLILEREGYPVDHKAIIDACAEQGVVIEINASPYRLDMDWRWVDYALEKGVMLSINPDAHKMEGYQDMYFGLQAGRKGGLSKEMNLNSMNLEEITTYFENRKKTRL